MIEDFDEPFIIGIFQMALVHEGDTKPLRRRLKHQLA